MTATFDFVELKVFLSSRVDRKLKDGPGQPTLREVRDSLVERIEEEELFGQGLLKVDRNEGWPALSGDLPVWEHCKRRVVNGDVVLVLYSGASGWRDGYGTIGICHAELQAAMERVPQRVRALQLPPSPPAGTKAERDADERFVKYWDRLGLPAPDVNTQDEIIDQALRTLREAVATLARSGAARTAGTQVGERLDWSLMSYAQRAEVMREQVSDALVGDGSNSVALPGRGPAGARLVNHRLDLTHKRVLIACHAIPAALGIAAARELVGEPFLHDHRLVDVMKKQRPAPVGPVHAIACHAGVTESQAIRQLGFPDATILRENFGVYVADDVQKIQIVLLKDCHDPSSTAERVADLRRWLSSTQEERRLVTRAVARRKIVDTIARHASKP